MKLSMGAIFGSSKKKKRSPRDAANSFGSSSSDTSISSHHNQSTPKSVLDLRITAQDLETALCRLSPDPPTSDQVVAAVMDLTVEDLSEPGGDEIREAFGVFDADGDGRISAEELHRVLLALGDEGGCSLDDCRRMIGGVDTDGDGFVCFDDFVRMMGVSVGHD